MQRAWIKEDDTWRTTNDLEKILDAPSEEVVFISDKKIEFKELQSFVNSRREPLPGASWIYLSYRGNASESEIPIVNDTKDINVVLSLFETHKELILPDTFGNDRIGLAKHNIVKKNPKGAELKNGRRGLDVHIYSPKRAKTILKRNKQYPTPAHLYNSELNAVVTEINSIISREFSQPVYGYDTNRTRSPLSLLVILAADAFCWFYGKGSYRSLASFKRLKEKWDIVKGRKSNKVPSNFEKFMNNELTKKPNKQNKLMKRTLLYKYGKK